MPPEEEARLAEWLTEQGLPNMAVPAPPPAPLTYSDEMREMLAAQQIVVSTSANSAHLNSSTTYARARRPAPLLSADARRTAEMQLMHHIQRRELRLTNSLPSHPDHLTNAHLMSMTADEANDLLYYVHTWHSWKDMPNRRLFPEPVHQWVRFTTSALTKKETDDTMLEQLLKLYTMFMATGATSPLPHFVGPPGSGKSTVFRTAADLLKVKVHTLNVARLSPLEIEGVQMPDKENLKLTLLHNPMWTQLEEGDIVLLDEFLRGFPEVYNALLDILTSREVAGYVIPRVFFAGASNSVATYDPALEDRLLHIPVDDPRKGSAAKARLAYMLIDALGLDPRVKGSSEMDELLEREVLPMYAVIDSFKGDVKVGAAGPTTSYQQNSIRKLIGQAQLRQVQSPHLAALLEENNRLAAQKGKHHYMFLTSGKNVPGGYKGAAIALEGALDQLTPLQRMNRELNLQLIEMEEQKSKAPNREDDAGDDPFS